VCRRAVLVVAERQRPHPRHSYRRRVGPHDPSDNGTVCQHVEIVIVPFARWAGSRCALEGKVISIRECLRGASLAHRETPPEQETGRGLGTLVSGCTKGLSLVEGSIRKTHGRAKGSSWNVRHEQPIWHALLSAQGIVPKTKAPSSVAQDGAKVTEGRVWVNPSAAKQFGGAEIVPVDRQPGAGDGFAGVARAYFCVLIFSMSAIGTVPSVSGQPLRHGLQRARPNCCRCRTST
jgi:hypothetical protein